jgi:CobQ-like glutamine amidotransferase family enzyme
VKKLVIGHLYGDSLNLYGDRGNIICLRQRARWRGIEVVVRDIGIGAPLPVDEVDLIFIGGGSDLGQKLIAEDLRRTKGEALRAAIEDDLPALAVCGGYQLFAHYYRPAEGPDLLGLGIFDAYTEHPGTRVPRCIGNVIVEWDQGTLVGFENHGGRTYLGPGVRPLGRVLVGHGNNATDRTEGAVYRNAFGTYLHGPVLPKNPSLTDHLLWLALRRRSGGAIELPPLDDGAEHRAHSAALLRARRGSRQ